MISTVFYDKVFSTIYWITGIIGVPSNLILLFLILKKTPDSLKVYRVLLFNACITDILFSLSTTLAQVRIIPNRWYFVYIHLGGSKFLGPSFEYEMYTLQLHSIFYTFLCFPLSFGFRYFVLIRPVPTPRTLALLCFLLWIPAFFQHWMFHFSQLDSTLVRQKLAIARPEYNLTGLVISGNFHMLEHPLVTVVLLTIILPMFPIYLLVMFFYKKINGFLSSHADKMSASTVANHRKLLIALSIQASLPVLFVFPPIGLYLLYHLEIFRCTLLEYLVFPIFSCYPAAAPFITIYYVRPYRTAIKRAIGRSSTTANGDRRTQHHDFGEHHDDTTPRTPRQKIGKSNTRPNTPIHPIQAIRLTPIVPKNDF
ncbi:unnamed protein product, partial [Mesorhabditis belari]|uniref:Uncharacterized protein n=1 Tax=Mesorhabditis belari TaxID=2138241 RepID=A0AAF3FKT5_9BILA